MVTGRRLRRRTTLILLVPFLWAACDGPSFAALARASQNPAKFLEQQADNLALPLTCAARARLQDAATRMRASTRRPDLPVARNDEGQTLAALRAVGEALAQTATGPGARLAAATSAPSEMSRAATGAKRRITALARTVKTQFAEARRELVQRNAPPELFERHAAARETFREMRRAVLADLSTVRRARDPETRHRALESAIARLRATGRVERHKPLDPRRLPVRGPDDAPRMPLTAPARLAAAQTLAAAASAPGPADLGTDDDVQITPAIQALAASLGNQPLAIYDWVHDNIEFVPTYGSVQGSQITLDARRGNAFDIASLLIALLRAAGIAARFTLGTIEVPTADAISWIDGAETPQVAQQLLGQGGVPTVAITSGGNIVRLRLDHVWVEAWVDFVPSRGAIHQTGDTWVPMDASFKRHVVLPPSGIDQAVPLDGTALANQMLAGATIDPALGAVTNPDTEVIEPVGEAYANDFIAYLDANNLPRTPIALYGGPQIVPVTSEGFAGSLPYATVASGAPAASLPAALRHYVTLRGFDSPFDHALGTPSYSHRVSLPVLGSHRLGIQFPPATPADAATLEAAVNGAATSIPVYLINVTPTVRIDGVTAATGGAVGMGSQHIVDVELDGPDGSTTVTYDNLNAGDEIVVGVTGNGVAPEVVQARFDAVPVDGPAEYLHQVQLHYWSKQDALNAIAARQMGVHMVRLPSVGLFSSPLTVSYLFGSPRSAVYQSRVMDVKHSILGIAGADSRQVVAFRRHAGYFGSFMEGQTFDQFEEVGRPRAVSSIHLLGAAAQNGDTIYSITAANLAGVLPHLSLPTTVVSDIQSAVSAGQTVLVSGGVVDTGPWSGVGYIVEDPATGAAAYLISGGINGGAIADCDGFKVPDWVIVLVIVILLAFLLWFYWAAIAAWLGGLVAGGGLVPQLAYALQVLFFGRYALAR